MIGDSLRNDVDGALAAGLRAVWVNRAGSPHPDDRPDLVEVRGLTALPQAVGRLRECPSAGRGSGAPRC
jgi:FMN phosphatase YigB (HAD superfamily)